MHIWIWLYMQYPLDVPVYILMHKRIRAATVGGEKKNKKKQNASF